MYDPKISPHDPKVMFIACDMTGLYRSENGGADWALCDARKVQGSSRFSVAFDPHDEMRVVGYHPQRGLVESKDRGKCWSGLAGPLLPDGVTVTAAAFSSASDLYLGTTNGLYRRVGGVWQAPVLTGMDEPVLNARNAEILPKVNSGDVIKILFVMDPSGAEVCFVATVRGIWRCVLPGAEFASALGNLKTLLAAEPGPYESFMYTDDDHPADPPLYIASPIRSLAGGFRPKKYYVLYVTLAGRRENAPGSAVGQGFSGGVYAVEVHSPGLLPDWSPRMGTAPRILNQNTFVPGLGEFAGTTIARYEHLAVAEQQPSTSPAPDPDTAYVSVINETFTPNIYKTTDRGANWDGVYAGYQKGTTNVEGGWIDVEPLAPTAYAAGNYGGLGWGSGGPAKGLATAPSNPNVVLMTNLGVVHKTEDGGQGASPDWQAKYTTKVMQPGVASPRWRTSGLEVTTTWHYVAHPTKLGIHFICATDVGLARSDDGQGDLWASVSQAWKEHGVDGLDEWQNWYELAFGANGVIWAAVSTQHDIPHATQLDVVKQGGVLRSDDDGQTWRRIGLSGGLPDKPIVSLVLGGPAGQERLYATAWGDGVYVSDNQGASWTRHDGLPGTRAYRLQFDDAGTLYCLVSGRGSGSGLYSMKPAGGWDDLTNKGSPSLRASVGGDAFLYPIDFALRRTPNGIDLYVSTQGVQGGPTGRAWKFDAGTEQWIDLNVTFKPNYGRSVEAFGVFFVSDKVFVTSTTHGIMAAKSADVEHSPPLSPVWVEAYPDLKFLSVQRIWPAGDGTIYITTFGGGVWRIRP